MVRTFLLPSRIAAFMLLALVLLLLMSVLGTRDSQGESFREVELYLYNPTPGNLVHEAPTGSTPTEVDMDTNPSGANQFSEVGSWATGDLTKPTNLSGDWSFSMWAMPDQNIDLDLRVTLRRAGGDIATLTGEASIEANQDGEVTASGNVAETEWDNNAIEVYVESRWDYTPPATGTLTSLKFRFGSSSLDAYITTSLAFVEISPGRKVDHNEDMETVKVYAQIDTSFGTDPLTREPDDYEMVVSWEGQQATLSSTTPTSSGEGFQVRFEWNYQGESLPAGDNTYTAKVTVHDAWLRASWTGEFDFELYVTPVPKLTMEASIQSKNIKPGETLKYSITISNPGTGPAPIELTLEDTLIDEDWKATLDKHKFELAPGDDSIVRLSITAPVTGSDGDQDFTRVIAITNDSFDLREEMTFTSTMKVPPPRYDLIISVEGDSSQTSWDLTAVQYSLRISNEGNRDDSFILQVEDNPGNLNIVFSPPRVSDLSPDDSGLVTVTVTPRAAFADDVVFWPHTVEIIVGARSESDDQISKSTLMELSADFSTTLILEGSSADIEIKQDQTGSGNFAVINRNDQASLELFFEPVFPKDVPGKAITTNRIKFYDNAGDEIDDENLIIVGPSSSVQITYRLTVPDWAVANVEHEIQIRALNADDEYVSAVAILKLTTLEGDSNDNTTLMLVVGILGVALVVGGGMFVFKPWTSDEEEDDLDILDTDPPLVDLPEELPSTLTSDEPEASRGGGLPALSFDASEPVEPPLPEAPAPSLPPPVGPAPAMQPFGAPFAPPGGGLPSAPPLPPQNQPPLPDPMPAPPMAPMSPEPFPPMSPEPFPPMVPQSLPPMAPGPAPFPAPGQAPVPFMAPVPAQFPPPPPPQAPFPAPMPAPMAPVPVEPVVVVAEPVAVEPIVVSAEPVVVTAEPVVVVAEQ